MPPDTDDLDLRARQAEAVHSAFAVLEEVARHRPDLSGFILGNKVTFLAELAEQTRQ